MDVDDDDAFLYGDQSPPPQPAAEKAETKPATAASALSASMAASLAAYGIDPTSAVAAENPEDGGVEEEDDDEDEDDSDEEDDVKLVFSGQATRLDLRKPQQASSNVIGIGKWAQTSTGQAAPTPTPSTPTHATPAPRAVIPTANQTTEYTPTSRPGTTPTPAPASHPTNAVAPPLQNPQIPQSGDGGTTPNFALPHSQLPPVLLPDGPNKVDPSNPSGIIPSTGNSVYDIDVAQFEGSGQPWRRPGSDIQDWFNFGFDEVTYVKFLRYRQEMEAGRNALMNMPMGHMTPDVANLLHLPNMMNMNMMNGMGNMGNMGNMGHMGLNPQQQMQMQQMQQMQQMAMGMDPMMQQNMQMQQMQGRPSVPSRPSATPAPTQQEGSEEVKQEEGPEPNQSEATVPEPGQGNFRGRGMARGMPARGTALRGRGGVIPSGPRAGVTLPVNIPKGPKASRQFKDKDKVENATSNLDYGDDEAPAAAVGTTGGGSRSRSVSSIGSPVKADRSKSRRQRERSYDDDYDSRDDEKYDRRSRSRSTRDRDSRSPSPRKDKRGVKERDSDRRRREKSKSTHSRRKEREEDDYTGDSASRRVSRDKRKRDEGGRDAVLGPGGWESEDDRGSGLDEKEKDKGRSSRRRRSYDSEDEDRYSRRSKRR